MNPAHPPSSSHPSRHWFICLLLCLLSLYSGLSPASEGFDPEQTRQELQRLSSSLDAHEQTLAGEPLDDLALLDLGKQLRSIREQLQSLRAQVAPSFDVAQANIRSLGPEPEGENAPAEPDNIQALRQELGAKAKQLEGLLKQTESLSFRNTRLLKDVASRRRDLFVDQLIEKQASPLSREVWLNTLGAYRTQLYTLTAPEADGNQPLLPALTSSALLFLVLLALTTYASARTLGQRLAKPAESDDSVMCAIARSLLLPLFGASIGLLVVYQVLHTQGLVTVDSQNFIHKCLGLTLLVTFMYLVTSRLAKAEVFRPGMRWMGFSAALLYALDAAFLESGRMMGAPLDLAIGQSYLVTSLFAVLLGIYSYQALRLAASNKHYFFPRQLLYLSAFLSVFILVANGFGFPALSRFFLVRMVLLFSLFMALMMLRYLIRPWLYRLDQLFHQNGPDTEEAGPQRLLFFWMSLIVDALLLLLALPLVAGILGADWNDIRDWALQAFLGFKVGAITISFSNIALAIAFFMALLFVTRLLQQVLGQKILPKTNMDESLRQSIIQVLGYVGLILALMVGISVLGFDLTNLALIAGALSVGIGFGLQSIVSNFVSGLILLFERPIKVGDWIITGSGEGIVKRISVRSTEIETFDRTSIIVPNSELITSSVKNWTHTDRIGRVIIPVGVSYDSDPHQVIDILLQCASDEQRCLKRPEPSVVFKDYADSALIFEVRFFIRNIGELPKISTEMRLSIWDALKAAHIEISYPQRDLHIRTAPGLKGLLHEPKPS